MHKRTASTVRRQEQQLQIPIEVVWEDSDPFQDPSEKEGEREAAGSPSRFDDFEVGFFFLC